MVKAVHSDCTLSKCPAMTETTTQLIGFSYERQVTKTAVLASGYWRVVAMATQP